MDIPQIQFVEAVTGEPILPESHAGSADGRLDEAGPDADDLDEAECSHCDQVHDLNRPCSCPECDGDGKLPAWGGRDWQRKPCEACHGTGELGG